MGSRRKKRTFAIVDIETTGGMYLRDKITEIAIIRTDGHELISEFQSLVNPERSIPKHITGITGIDNHMVKDAPKFYEIAKRVIQELEGCIFVAHNVNFDYNFIKEEFKSLGYPFNKKKLCTVKLARSVVQGLRSYSLDSLIENFDVHVEKRHRAYDDTLATFKIFKYIYNDLSTEYHVDKLINQGLDASVLPKGMEIEEVHGAPETPGVYYLSNQYDHVMYVGKAKNIKSRIFQHFRKISLKSNKIYSYVDRLHYEETGNELTALLLELYEIKRLRPEFNKSMKRQNYSYALYLNEKTKDGNKTLLVGRNNNSNDFKYEKVKLFSTKASAEGFLQQFIMENELCSSLFYSRARKFECFCEGDCENFFQDPSAHLDDILMQIKNEFDKDFVIILQGRSLDEKSFVMIHERRFWGYGYVPRDEVISSREQWNDFVNYQFWYPEANGIIKNFLSKHNCEIIDL